MGLREQLLIADDSPGVIEGLTEIFEHSPDGHSIVGAATSVEEVKELMEGGLKPTVALVDNQFPYKGAGEEAARIIRQHSPETFVISFSNDPGLKWGDDSWNKAWGMENEKSLVAEVTKLQHKRA
jgi:DNA-binding NarL/FixJ family response regulator